MTSAVKRMEFTLNQFDVAKAIELLLESVFNQELLGYTKEAMPIVDLRIKSSDPKNGSMELVATVEIKD